MENYAQKYKEALERAKKFANSNYRQERYTAEEIFPELRESEDERIRKGLIGHLKECRNNTRSEVMLGEYAKWISWLEKQGEQKFKVGDWIINNDKRIAVPTQILKIEKYGYATSMGYTSFDKVKTDYHLWTIQDAKDGDVLSFNDGHGNDCIELIKSINIQK